MLELSVYDQDGLNYGIPDSVRALQSQNWCFADIRLAITGALAACQVT